MTNAAIETTCVRCERPIIVPPTGMIVCHCGMRIWANQYSKGAA